jgi:hypothetical protein
MVESTEIMNEAGFELHKWHSNCPAVKWTNNANENETTYAKAFFGNASSNETKILGLPWNKKTDAMTIIIILKTALLLLFKLNHKENLGLQTYLFLRSCCPTWCLSLLK